MTLPLPVCQFLSSLTAVILPGSAAAPPSLDCLSSGADVEITDTTWYTALVFSAGAETSPVLSASAMGGELDLALAWVSS